MIKKLSHVSILSNDFDKVHKFYIDILKFKIAHMFTNNQNEVYGMFLHAGKGTFIEFFKSDKKLLNNSFDHICFEVENISEIKNKFNHIPNLKITRGRTDNILQFKVKDYEINLIEFHQHDERSKLKNYINE